MVVYKLLLRTSVLRSRKHDMTRTRAHQNNVKQAAKHLPVRETG